MSVGLVVVSHSEKIATGVVELATEMARSIRIVAAGGTDDGRIGTSFDKVSAAIVDVAHETGDTEGGGVVVLCDLGSAILTTETTLEFLDDRIRARVRIADAPLVEGAVAAAVAAETGGSLSAVLAAAQSANAGAGEPANVDTAEESAAEHPESDSASTFEKTPTFEKTVSSTATLANKEGLHARPAAEFVKLASTFDAKVTVNGVDAKSLLRIMSLGLTVGSEANLSATGPDASAAVNALVELINSAFGE